MSKYQEKNVTAQHSTHLEETWWQLLWARHLQALVASWKRLYKNSFATVLTIVVIAISLALPAILLVSLSNLSRVGQGFQDSAAISLYLKPTLSQADIDALVSRLKGDNQIASVRYISPAEGLQSFSQTMGLSDALGALPNNPLPPVIVLTPSMSAPAEVSGLLSQLSRLPGVDSAGLDMQWVKRLYAILDLLHRLVFGLTLLLGFGVLTVIGNTIRLALQQHREEIAIMKLMGASNAFARRPFLYTGIWYGVLGGFLAWLLVSLLVLALGGAAHTIAADFNSGFHLEGLGVLGFLLLLFFGGLLGLAGSWIVVEHFINRVDRAGA